MKKMLSPVGKSLTYFIVRKKPMILFIFLTYVTETTEKTSGYTNLKKHIQTMHPHTYTIFSETIENEKQLDVDACRYSQKAIKYLAWMVSLRF